MATITEQLQDFTQSVYLVIKGKYFDDITGDDGDTLVAQTIDWTNQYLDELESEVDPNGAPVNWRWMRENGFELGSATQGETAIDLDDEILNLIAEEGRYVEVLDADDEVLSQWLVVDASEVSNRSGRVTDDRCAIVGEEIVFSREFNDQEDGGTIIGDVTLSLTRMSATNIDILTTVKPKQLLILGTAKNASLPDIVQGGLSPSFAQKYSDLLQNAIARNGVSSAADAATRDDFSGISGVGF